MAGRLFFQGYTQDTGQQFWSFISPEYISCDGATVSLEVSNSAGDINWYFDEAGSSLAGVGATIDVGPFSSDTTLWASLEMQGCESELVPFDIQLVKLDSLVFDSEICEGGSTLVQAFATGDETVLSYSLDLGSSQVSPDFPSVTAGDHTLQVSQGECDITEDFTITELPIVNWYFDGDADGFGVTETIVADCHQPVDHVTLDGDCDDENSAIYPGAIGAGDDVDADCDGFIDQTETSCPGDLDYDGDVDTADLLAFLTSFGCVENCLVDLDGDDQVNTSDMLGFLTLFGQSCD